MDSSSAYQPPKARVDLPPSDGFTEGTESPPVPSSRVERYIRGLGLLCASGVTSTLLVVATVVYSGLLSGREGRQFGLVILTYLTLVALGLVWSSLLLMRVHRSGRLVLSGVIVAHWLLAGLSMAFPSEDVVGLLVAITIVPTGLTLPLWGDSARLVFAKHQETARSASPIVWAAVPAWSWLVGITLNVVAIGFCVVVLRALSPK